jgi:uncharacterized protein (DUF1800 family)
MAPVSFRKLFMRKFSPLTQLSHRQRVFAGSVPAGAKNMQKLHRTVAILLAFCLVQNVSGIAAEGSKNQAVSTARQNTPQQAMHALNRLTFGPRPGDVEHVQAIGVERWIEQQLHPEKIDDSLLEGRLALYPAIHLSGKELASRFPSQQTIRMAAAGRLPIPRDPESRAIYQVQAADYEKKRLAKKETVSNKADNSIQKADATNAEDSSDVAEVHENNLYADIAVASTLTLPPDQRIARLISMKPDELSALKHKLTPQETMALFSDLTPRQKEIVVALDKPEKVVAGELLASRLLTDIYSERQLQAVMTDFWLNHFNVFLRKGPNAPWYLVQYQNQVIAPRALGKFEDLLVATAQSPAMLFYLDNHSSIGPHSQAVTRAAYYSARFGNKAAEKASARGLNENYAREVMELHTLGVDGGYAQKDVTELAKVLTGWTIDQQNDNYKFEERRHEPGNKYVLGKTIKESGEKEGLQVLHMLATNPATAHFLSRKLAIRFVSDDPPEALVDRMAKTYMHTDGDIREVLRTLFHSPEFWSPDAYRAKVKTPLEFVVSAVRATGGNVQHPAPLLQALNRLGMPMYGCQTPNGYSWTAQAWINSADLVSRMNFAMSLAANQLGSVSDFSALLKEGASTPEEKESILESMLLGLPASPQTKQAALQQAETSAPSPMLVQAASEPIVRTPRASFAKGDRKMGLGDLSPDVADPLPLSQDRQAMQLAGLLLGSPEFQRK